MLDLTRVRVIASLAGNQLQLYVFFITITWATKAGQMGSNLQKQVQNLHTAAVDDTDLWTIAAAAAGDLV